jgi:hypothetical protein
MAVLVRYRKQRSFLRCFGLALAFRPSDDELIDRRRTVKSTAVTEAHGSIPSCSRSSSLSFLTFFVAVMPTDAYVQLLCKVRSRFRTASTKKFLEDNPTTAGTRLCLTWHGLVISFLVRRMPVGPAYASCTHRSCFAWFVLRQMIRLEERETSFRRLHIAK